MGNEESHSSSEEEKKDDTLQLTKIQIRQIRNLWRMAQSKGNAEPGRSILVAILARNPEAGAIFRFADPTKSENPLGHLDLTIHARRFNGEIEFMIQHLERPQIAMDHFQTLGSHHVAFQGNGFTTKLWDTFADCMVEKTIEWGTRSQRNESSQEAWGKIVLFLIDCMKTGYYDTLRSTKPGCPTRTFHKGELPTTLTSKESRVECARGYKADPLIVTCAANGTWSDIPWCKRVCPPLHVLHNEKCTSIIFITLMTMMAVTLVLLAITIFFIVMKKEQAWTKDDVVRCAVMLQQ